MSRFSDRLFEYNSHLVSLVYTLPHTLNRLANAKYTPEDAFTLYHLIQEETGSKSRFDGPALPALGHALAGAVASALSKSLVYPIDTIVTRMQVQKGLKGEKEADSAATEAGVEYKDPVDAARKIYNNEGGLGAFYAGLTTDIAKHVGDAFLFFLAYNAARDRLLKQQGGKQLSVAAELGVGVVAGALSKAVTQPISNIVVRQQTAALVAARDPTSSTTPAQSDHLSVRSIVTQIRIEKGVAGFWSGYSAQLILTSNPAITFAADNILRSLVPKRYRENPTAIQTFLIAAFSKVIATSLTYPVMLAKSRAQASASPPSLHSSNTHSDPEYHKIDPTATTTQLAAKRAHRALHRTLRRLSRLLEGQAALLHSLRKIYANEGLGGLYSGLEGEVVKGFLQHGLTMMVKENVHGGVIQLYYVLLKLTKRWPQELEKVKDETGAVAQDAAKRAANVGVSVVEGMKNMGRRVTGEE
ncbi:hypothetical protein DOTSEDRAFT_87807 [Dothistroma septosporum NZE10]|uniref:Mitochondrial carrier-like protein n=1 Tax=Dothistroma septosporum (strain NZE10 / CBS 128990) TaxID=675120 RepID=N1PPV7_DOTSN|nr:hypothetical protein DOTSEDRAFT_87807 [Dothistroma septosporum NZE10]